MAEKAEESPKLEILEYTVRVQHDGGKVNFGVRTLSRDTEQVRKAVMILENCPPCAILSVSEPKTVSSFF